MSSLSKVNHFFCPLLFTLNSSNCSKHKSITVHISLLKLQFSFCNIPAKWTIRIPPDAELCCMLKWKGHLFNQMKIWELRLLWFSLGAFICSSISSCIYDSVCFQISKSWGKEQTSLPISPFMSSIHYLKTVEPLLLPVFCLLESLIHSTQR